MKQTMIDRYGVEHSAQSDICKNKMKQTNIKRYGCEYVTQNENIKNIINEKRIKTMCEQHKILSSAQQRYICKLINGELNKKIGKYVGDITINSKMIDIEYDSSGHRMSINWGITDDEFDKKENIRNDYIINKGWSIIRISSKKDMLPIDSELIDAINLCINLTNTNKLITLDIDNHCIKYNDIIININFTKLRRIKGELKNGKTKDR